jgi:4-amino-4-deoxychorismate lyase
MYQPFKVIVAQLTTNAIAEPVSSLITDSAFAQCSIGYADRGLQYGDGCFTTMYCEGNTISLFEQHVARLVHDAERLKMVIEHNRVINSLTDVLNTILEDNKQCLAVKLLVTRGYGGRGYAPPTQPLLHLYISFHACEKAKINNVTLGELSHYRVRPCSFTLGSQALLAGIKHLNRLEQVLAKHEVQSLIDHQHPVDDLIMRDQDDNIVEFVSGNLFFYSEGSWHTPDLQNAGVNGVMRAALIDYMHTHDIPFKIGHYAIEHLINAESVLVCNAIKHLLGVTELEYLRQGKLIINNIENVQLSLLTHGFIRYLNAKYTAFERVS